MPDSFGCRDRSDRSPESGGSAPIEPRLVDLAHLTHHRWSLPVLAALVGRTGVRFAELQAAVPASRQPLRDAVTALVETGTLERHSGHGHPLRPEYLLSARGAKLAPAARRLLAEAEKAAAGELSARKWSLPVLAALLGGAERFGELGSSFGDDVTCPPPSPRALALALRDLEIAGLVRREVRDGHPPQVRYRATLPRGLRAALLALLGALGT